MWDANVGHDDAGARCGGGGAASPRIVYVSTVNVFGNTHGRVVDETYRRDLGDGFLSWYDETKYGAHEVAEAADRGRRADRRSSMPGQVIRAGRPHRGRRAARAARTTASCRTRRWPTSGCRPGPRRRPRRRDRRRAGSRRGSARRTSSPATRIRLGDALAIAARLGGQRLPRVRIPTALLRAMAPLGAVDRPSRTSARSSAASAGVTYWATPQRREGRAGLRAARPRDRRSATRSRDAA